MKRELEKGTPLDLIRQMGQMSRKVAAPKGMPVNSMLATFQGRLTYTFLIDREVASIHFDQKRGEIFYRGHNIANMSLSSEQLALLKGLMALLASDERGKPFLPDYTATLTRLLADNKDEGDGSISG